MANSSDSGPFFERLSDDERRWLESRGRVMRFGPGSVLVREGDISGRVDLLVAGRVKASVSTIDGHEVVLAVRGPGDLIGELSALDGLPHSASTRALEPVEVLSVAAEDFRTFLHEHPAHALGVLAMLASRLRDADRKRVEFGASDTVGRVASRLVEMAETHGRATGLAVTIDLPLTQAELAGWVGASREAVTRALRALRERGWITTARRSIAILDLEALRQRAT